MKGEMILPSLFDRMPRGGGYYWSVSCKSETMSREKYTGQEEADLTAKRAVYEYGRQLPRSGKKYEHGKELFKNPGYPEDVRGLKIQYDANMENEFRDLIKKRGVEIPDIDLIVRVTSIDDGWIMISTTDGSEYLINPVTREGKIRIAKPEVDTTNALGGDITMEDDPDTFRTFVTEAPDVFNYSMTDLEAYRFIAKYQPRLLAELYLQAEYNEYRKGKDWEEKKYGDLSF